MPSWIEIVGFVTGAACVWLLVKENIWNWPVAIASCLLYLVVFWRAGLFADAVLQLFFVAISIYGWWNWLHGGPRHGRLRVSRITLGHAAVTGAATAAAAGILFTVLARFTPSTVPLWDGTTTALSISGQYLQARKLIETWWVWIAADVLYVALYLYKDLWLTAILYAIYLAMCVAGLAEWRRALRQAEKIPPPAALATG